MKKTNTIRQKPSRLWAGKEIQPVADSSSSESEHEVKEEVRPVKLEEFLVKVEVKTEDTTETLRRRERARANAEIEEEEMPVIPRLLAFNASMRVKTRKKKRL
jgi:hypothetical protein